MVQTITPVVHGGRRSRWVTSIGFHAVGAGISSGAFGAALGVVGSFLGAPWGRDGVLLISGVALLYAAREAFGLPIPIPDRRRQVPEWWRSTFSPNGAALLYGLGLGVGFLTYVRHGTLVAVSTVALASGDPLVGAIVMAAFGLARGLSVAVGWSAVSTERVQSVVDRLESLAEGRVTRIANTMLLLVVGLSALFLPAVGGQGPALRVAPLALALVFGWAALAKWTRSSRWRETLRVYALPKRLEILALSTVPTAEATVPVLGLSGQTKQMAALAVVLLIVFSAAVLSARFRHGAELPCGCFGRGGVRDYRALLLRNLVLSIAAITILAGQPSRPLLDGLRGPHVREVVPAMLVLAGLVLATVAVTQIRRLRSPLSPARASRP